MKIFQYCLLVNRNGVVVLTAKGIVKILMKHFTNAFVRGVYVQQCVNTITTTFVCNTTYVPIYKIVVSLLSLFYQRVFTAR
jgi:hypothetical protein